jgi:hypothetical protein
MRYRLVVMCALVLVLGGAALGATLKVPSHYAAIQDAINAATPGDTVAVAAGSYLENIQLKNGVIVLGGWNAGFTQRDPSVFKTTIDGHSNGSVVVAYSPVDSTSVIDGFVITNGSGTEDPMNAGTYLGGGILVYFTPGPKIVNNEIRGNVIVPNGRGGGISAHDASPVIDGNVIVENTCVAHYGFGAGINLGNCGGRVTRNYIANNLAGGDGGGLRADGGRFSFVDNEILNNTSGINGGGLSLDHSLAYIGRNTIRDNSALSLGGGIFGYAVSSTIELNVIAGNAAGADGGICCLASPAPHIAQNTIVGNSSNEGGQIGLGEGCSPTVDHNIVACNQSGTGLSCNWDCAPTLLCNDIWGNCKGNYAGACADQTGINGNISADPIFCSLPGGIYALASASPALNQDCGFMGALSVSMCDSTGTPSCDCPIGVKRNSWGDIKSLYNK